MTTDPPVMVTLKCATCRQEFQKPSSRGRYPSRCDACSGRSAPTRVRDEHRLNGDPPRRADGRCACGCGKKLPASKEARKYAGAQIDADPFASSECCKRWHGVSWATTEEEDEVSARKARGGSIAAQQFAARHPNTTPGVFAR